MDGSKRMVLLGLTLCLLVAFVNSRPNKSEAKKGAPRPPSNEQSFSWPEETDLFDPNVKMQPLPWPHGGSLNDPKRELQQREIEYNGIRDSLQYGENPLWDTGSWTENYKAMLAKQEQVEEVRRRQ